jgi:hypothetical protein
VSAFLRLLTAFLTVALTETVLVVLFFVAAFAIANGFISQNQTEDGQWPQIRRTDK